MGEPKIPICTLIVYRNGADISRSEGQAEGRKRLKILSLSCYDPVFLPPSCAKAKASIIIPKARPTLR